MATAVRSTLRQKPSTQRAGEAASPLFADGTQGPGVASVALRLPSTGGAPVAGGLAQRTRVQLQTSEARVPEVEEEHTTSEAGGSGAPGVRVSPSWGGGQVLTMTTGTSSAEGGLLGGRRENRGMREAHSRGRASLLRGVQLAVQQRQPGAARRRRQRLKPRLPHGAGLPRSAVHGHLRRRGEWRVAVSLAPTRGWGNAGR